MTEKKISRSLIAIMLALLACSVVISCKPTRVQSTISVRPFLKLHYDPKVPLKEDQARAEVEKVRKILFDYIDSFNVANKTSYKIFIYERSFRDKDGNYYPEIEVKIYKMEGPGTVIKCPPVPPVWMTDCPNDAETFQ